MKLSLVIPSKNEEASIGRCLDSLLQHASSITPQEIILVDCASNDKTILAAKNYPIKIYQLKPQRRHTAAAARYVGTKFSKGDFIFFIDADMALEPGFLDKAIEFLQTHKNIVGVGGIGNEIFLEDGKITGSRKNLYRTRDTQACVQFLGGAALYDRRVLASINGFHPYLAAGEEREMAQRIRQKGYQLASLPCPMITHYTCQISEWQEFERKKNAKMFFGIGQAIRLSRSPRFLIETLTYYKEFSFFIFCLLAEITLSIFLLPSNYRTHYTILVLPFGIPFLFLCLKKRNLKTALLSFAKWIMLSLEIYRGICLRPPCIDQYPIDPLIIQGDFNA